MSPDCQSEIESKFEMCGQRGIIVINNFVTIAHFSAMGQSRRNTWLPVARMEFGLAIRGRRIVFVVGRQMIIIDPSLDDVSTFPPLSYWLSDWLINLRISILRQRQSMGCTKYSADSHSSSSSFSSGLHKVIGKLLHYISYSNEMPGIKERHRKSH